MIQRIQSIYLFVAGLASGLMFIFPVSSYYGSFYALKLQLLKLQNLAPDGEALYPSYFTYPLALFVAVIAILSFVSIFQYKKMKYQLKNVKINIFFNIILIVSVFFVYSKMILMQINVDEEYEIGAFLPLLSLVCLVLAYRAIKKDKELVESVDRLR